MAKYLLDTNTRKVIDELLERFPITEEWPQLFPTWLNLVTDNDVKGKRTHDTRIIAVMRVSEIHHILTLNPHDFSGVSDYCHRASTRYHRIRTRG